MNSFWLSSRTRFWGRPIVPGSVCSWRRMAHRAENDAVSDECDGIAGVGMTAKLAEVTSAAKAQEYPVGRHPRGRGVPTCTAQACAQVALDGGLCPAHRRAVKLTAEISDA